MGISTIVAHTMLLIVTVSAVLTLSHVFLTNIDSLTGSLSTRYNALSKEIQTDFVITSVHYDSGTVNITAKNIGSSILRTDLIEVFIDNTRISKSPPTNISVASDTDSINSGFWDPYEVISISVSKTLSSGSHYIELYSENGISDSQRFSV